MNTRTLNPFPKEVIKMRDGWMGRFFSVITQADKAAFKCSLLFQEEFIMLQLVWARQAVQHFTHAASPALVAAASLHFLNDQGDLQWSYRMKRKYGWLLFISIHLYRRVLCATSSAKQCWCRPVAFVPCVEWPKAKATLKNKGKSTLCLGVCGLRELLHKQKNMSKRHSILCMGSRY